MNKRRHAPIKWIVVVALVICSAPLLAQKPQDQAQLNILMSGGYAAAFRQMQPEFERVTGVKLVVTTGPSQGGGPNAIGEQLRRGVPADVVIMSRDGLKDLIAEGRIIAGSDVNIAQSPLGISVRTGAPKPDISSVEAFKRTMLQAKSVTCVSSPRIYLVEKLFPRLGIGNEMASKLSNAGVAAVGKGDVEMAVRPVSELLNVPSTDFVGTLPPEIQYVAVFSAAIVKGTKEPTQAKALIDFLASEKAKAAAEANGMEPIKKPDKAQ